MILWLLRSYTAKPDNEVLREINEIYELKFALCISGVDDYFKR